MTLELSPQVFAITSHLIEERAGLHYSIADQELLADKISQRAEELGFDSLLDYYYFLRYDDEGERELQNLVENLVVHETYFFREPYPLLVLVEAIIPEMLRTRSRVRLWSAACATGEEPYTMAMLLARAGLGDQVEIVASDISAAAIGRARAGVYGPRSMRRMHDDERFRGCLDVVDGKVRVPESVRARVRWKQVNLIDAAAVRNERSFDVVLCRNVLIYFADATVKRIAKTLSDVLIPGGVLVVGTAESLLRFATSFVCEERGGAFFYRKPVE